MSEISERILKALLPKPLCRDCADNDGRCPNDGELCDSVERAKELSELVEECCEAAYKNFKILEEETAKVEEELEAENKTLKAEIEELETSCTNRFVENQELKKSRDKMLKELKEVEETGLLPDGDSIHISTQLWLERLIETLKDKEE